MTAIKQETPGGNPGSASNPSEKEMNMSSIADTTDMANCFIATPGHPFYKEPEARMSIPVDELRTSAVEQVRNKPDNIPAIAFNFVTAFKPDGSAVPRDEQLAPDAFSGLARTPDMNTVVSEEGISYVWRGFYWSDGFHTEDGVEYVDFTIGQMIPCTEYSWCMGHWFEWDDTLSEPHDERDTKLWDFGNLELTAARRREDGNETFDVRLHTNDNMDMSWGHPALSLIADELEKAAASLRLYADRMDAK